MPTKRKSAKPVFVKMLDVSTGHITKTDAEKLENDAAVVFGGDCPTSKVIVENFRYGYNVHVLLDCDVASIPYSENFKKILKFSAKNGASWVRFDRDGETYQQFETFDW